MRALVYAAPNQVSLGAGLKECFCEWTDFYCPKR